MSIQFLHYLWIAPLETIIVTYFLWQEIGVSSVVGVVVLLMFIPLQGLYNKNMVVRNEHIILINPYKKNLRTIKVGLEKKLRIFDLRQPLELTRECV